MTTMIAWFLLWAYCTGVILFAVVYTVAWHRTEPPPSRSESLMTMFIVLTWPALVIWACLVQMRSQRWTDSEYQRRRNGQRYR